MAAPLFAQLPAGLYDGLTWRFIGPFRGGRVLAVTGVPGDATTFYFGSVGGGVWKTTNAGTVWSPIFDGQDVASIGAIAVAPSDPKTIYVGTGEADMRSAISFGDGMYKSTDAGATWRHIGLRDSRQISRIAVDPKNPNLVYVAVLGHAYAPNPERGVFRSKDGGETWDKVLDKGPEVGAADLAMEPENPKVIYAAMWNSRRPPWSQYGPLEGPGSGLYKTSDGGDTWTELAGNGLPEGQWGRAGVAVAAGTRGRRVYALVDAKPGGLFRSDDSGKSWSEVSSDTRITSRGWYFSGITVDPHNPDLVYIPNVAVYQSSDGGKNFRVLKGAPGGDDYHSLWIDPTLSSRMILGSDQGTNISLDTGQTWTPWYNQATAQLYHVVADNQFPYWVYASQQDSGTVALPSRTDHGQINEYDRRSVGGAESGYIAVDPKNPNIFYVNNTNGSLTRFDRRTSEGQNITPWPEPGFGTEINQRKYRFPWTAPVVFSAADPTTLYYGSQYLLKSVDGGLHWIEASPDLTGTDLQTKTKPSGPPTVENAKGRGYGVIYTIGPSPLSAPLIWVGSDTGLVHVTRDGGKDWSNVTPKGLSDWSKITHIEASHFDQATAYAAVDRHRLDDYKPHLFRTHDYGKTWMEITSGIEEPAFLNAIREDPTRKGLLYAATETGVYVSFDDGDHWQPLQANLPVTSVRDVVVHGDDLVIATHGRGFWIMDDITPLRQASATAATEEAVLYKPSPAIRMVPEPFQGTPFPPETPKAQNPPDGAIIDYYLKSAAEEVTLDILDAQNQVVRSYSTKDAGRPRRSGGAIADIWITPPPHLAGKAGMNRFVWDLRFALPAGAEGGRGGGGGGGGANGPQVKPGLYHVRLTAGGKTYTQPLKVVLDPRSTATPQDLALQFDLGQKILRQMRRLADLRQEIRRAHRQSTEVDAIDSGLSAAGRDLSAALGVVNSSDRRPPAQAAAVFQDAVHQIDLQAAAWNALNPSSKTPSNR